MAFSRAILLLAALAVLAPVRSAPTLQVRHEGHDDDTTSAAPAATGTDSGSFLKQNGLDAQVLNAKFDKLSPSDACTEGDMACVNSAFAQCVSGKWVLSPCSATLKCFALPLLLRPGTTINCDSPADAASRFSSLGLDGGVNGAGANATTPASASASPTEAAAATATAAASSAASSPSATATASGDDDCDDDDTDATEGDDDTCDDDASDAPTATASPTAVVVKSATPAPSVVTATVTVPPSTQTAESAASTTQAVKVLNPVAFSDSAKPTPTTAAYGPDGYYNERQVLANTAAAAAADVTAAASGAAATLTVLDAGAASGTAATVTALPTTTAAGTFTASPTTDAIVTPTVRIGNDGIVTVTLVSTTTVTAAATDCAATATATGLPATATATGIPAGTPFTVVPAIPTTVASPSSASGPIATLIPAAGTDAADEPLSTGLPSASPTVPTSQSATRTGGGFVFSSPTTPF